MNERRIGEFIKTARKNTGKTQLQIAQQAGISRNYLSDLENDRYYPSLKILFKLDSILNLDLGSISKKDVNTLEIKKPPHSKSGKGEWD